MNKFILNLILFLTTLILISYLTDFVMTQGLKKSKSFHYHDWNKIHKGAINADIVINGNSKAWHHISPKIIDSLLHVNSYNLGIDGFDFVMQNAKYNLYLMKNKQPKVIVQVIGINTLKMRKDLFQMEQFLPYLSDTIIKNASLKYKGLTALDYNLPLMKYAGHSQLVSNSIISLLGFSDLQKDQSKYKGYEAYDKEWDNSFENYKKTFPDGRTYDIEDYSFNLFNKYLKEEVQKGVKIVLVFSPTYFESQKYVKNRVEIINTYIMIAKKNNIDFYDYSSHFITKNKDYFYNSQHLNKKGAELFSKILSNKLKEILNTPK